MDGLTIIIIYLGISWSNWEKKKKLKVLLRKSITQPALLFHCRMFVRSKCFNFMIHTIQTKRGWASRCGMYKCVFVCSLFLFLHSPSPKASVQRSGYKCVCFCECEQANRKHKKKLFSHFFPWHSFFYLLLMSLFFTCHSPWHCTQCSYTLRILGTDSKLTFFFFSFLSLHRIRLFLLLFSHHLPRFPIPSSELCPCHIEESKRIEAEKEWYS